jgi:hypothetical protein
MMEGSGAGSAFVTSGFGIQKHTNPTDPDLDADPNLQHWFLVFVNSLLGACLL